MERSPETRQHRRAPTWFGSTRRLRRFGCDLRRRHKAQAPPPLKGRLAEIWAYAHLLFAATRASRTELDEAIYHYSAVQAWGQVSRLEGNDAELAWSVLDQDAAEATYRQVIERERAGVGANPRQLLRNMVNLSGVLV